MLRNGSKIVLLLSLMWYTTHLTISRSFGIQKYVDLSKIVKPRACMSKYWALTYHKIHSQDT